MTLSHFKAVWVCDFEFHAPRGHRPRPLCLVAEEVNTGQEVRLWLDSPSPPLLPIPFDSNSLFVAYFASAEIGCFLELGWPLPRHVLDLYAEFRVQTNGQPTPSGNALIGAAIAHGIPGAHEASSEKDRGRDLAIRGGPYTQSEQDFLLEYCTSDVRMTKEVLECMQGSIDWPRALLRGRYMKAVALMENIGVPVEVDLLERIVSQRETIREELIAQVDRVYGVYVDNKFKRARFEEYLIQHNIPWPRLSSGWLDLDKNVFESMSQSYPALKELHELRQALSKLQDLKLTWGPDRRNRTLLSPFRSKTGRNAPSSARFIFGQSRWIRHTIRPEKGSGLAYLDWSHQEVGIAAALSEDENMLEAYRSGDPYLTAAIQARAAPPGATKATHAEIRSMFKTVILGVQYGMGADSLAKRLRQSPAYARELLGHHKRIYRKFWDWSDRVVTHARLHGHLFTSFGWGCSIGADTSVQTVRNFLMQANGADMMRLACIRATESGVRVCAPIHDALLIEAPLDELDGAVESAQEAMLWAAQQVLNGFELRTDAQIIRYPEHFRPEGGQHIWDIICAHLQENDETDP